MEPETEKKRTHRGIKAFESNVKVLVPDCQREREWEGEVGYVPQSPRGPYRTRNHPVRSQGYFMTTLSPTPPQLCGQPPTQYKVA